MTTTVSLCACADYGAATVQAAVDACFAELGGLDAFVQPGDRVLLKPNLLMPAKPEQAITTHPEVLRAVIRAVKAVGGVPCVGDSPAATPLRVTAKRAGLLAVVEAEGATLADMGGGPRIRSERVAGQRDFEVAQAVLDADVVINLPKLKTHALTYVTIAQKNLFGVVPGLQKGRWHMVAQTPEHFAGLLADLYASIVDHPDGPRQLLHLVDGVVALGGNGPGTGGTPHPLGALLAGADAVAVDRVACAVAGLDADRAPLLRISGERGLGEHRLEAITLTGTPLSELQGSPMQPPKGRESSPSLQAAMWSSARMRNLVLDRPNIHREPCVACGHCERICPAEAIHTDTALGAARVDYTRCIRCYCCAEICPHAAIGKSDLPPIGKLLTAKGARRAVPLGVAGLGVGVALALGLYMAADQASPPRAGDATAPPPPAAARDGRGPPPPGGPPATAPTPEQPELAKPRPPQAGVPTPGAGQPARSAAVHALPLARAEDQLLRWDATGNDQHLERAAEAATRLVRQGERHDYPRFLLAFIRQLQGRDEEAQALLAETHPSRGHIWARFLAPGAEHALPYLAANVQQACADSGDKLGGICQAREPAEAPSDYQAYRQASWPPHSRDRLRAWGVPDSSVSAFFGRLGIEPGMTVADIGAGEGWFAVPLAQHLAGGTLHAVELDPGLVETLAFAAEHHGLDRLRAVQGQPASIGLAPASIDAAFACEVLRQVYASPQAERDPQHVARFLGSIATAVKSGGRLLVIEHTDPARHPQAVPSAQLIQDIQAAGFASVDCALSLSTSMQLLCFEKRAD